jgi:hypothetical protein
MLLGCLFIFSVWFSAQMVIGALLKNAVAETCATLLLRQGWPLRSVLLARKVSLRMSVQLAICVARYLQLVRATRQACMHAFVRMLNYWFWGTHPCDVLLTARQHYIRCRVVTAAVQLQGLGDIPLFCCSAFAKRFWGGAVESNRFNSSALFSPACT